VAMHGSGRSLPQRRISPNSFKYFQMMKKRAQGLVAASV
jgi:hypothetical protein